MRDVDDALFHLKNFARRGQAIDPQRAVEARVVALMFEFPTMSDADVATLARDEVLNAAGHEPALLRWATEETVARMRRTIVLDALRGPPMALAPPQPPPPWPMGLPAAPPSSSSDAKALVVGILIALLVAMIGVWLYGIGLAGR